MNKLHKQAIKLLFATALIFIHLSCENSARFTIEGEIKEGKGKMLYLSNIGINGSTKIDSVKLKSDGRFCFEEPRPECYDFYALQLQGAAKRITIAIDSTETVSITTQADSFADSCTISGSPETLRIREIAMLENALQQQVNDLIRNTTPAIGETKENIYNLIGEFKKNIFGQYIASAPHTASAYYALFLRVNGEPIFAPTSNRFDSHCFAAVANCLHTSHPHATRAIHIYNVARKGLAATRPATPADTINIDSKQIERVGIYNIELPDINGSITNLRDLKGKVVLLDFTIYSNPLISSRNIKLREIYDKYHDKGFEIYQVSFDENENFWSNSADRLPWICVRDEAGESSKNILLYNLQELPTFYLINRDNEIVYRDKQIEDLNTAIEELLK